MIKTPTVFILGAGASIPYGFPSGLLLREIICGASNINNEFHVTFREQFSLSEAEVIAFGNAFQKSQIASIDSFLARRSEFVEIGKFAIASVLCPLEVSPPLYSPATQDNWYFELWNRLMTNVSNPQEFLSNNVNIITFNYDRSLEHFLFNAILNTFKGISEQSALGLLNHLSILHVYGQLGKYGQSLSGDTRPYDSKINSLSLHVAAKGIKIIPEARDDDEVFTQTSALLNWAQRICFLGFGFDELNVQRLGINHVLNYKFDQGVSTHVVTSAHGKTNQEMQIAADITGAVKHTFIYWYPVYEKSLTTIREHAMTLR